MLGSTESGKIIQTMVSLHSRSQTPAMVQALAELVEHLGRSVQQSCFAQGLKPAQWSALRYLSRANPSARTVSGMSAAMLTTKSTTSQTVRVLRGKGLVAARRNKIDVRIVDLTLTSTGQRVLESDPLNPLIEALRGLSPEEFRIAARAMEILLHRTKWLAYAAPRRQ